MRPTFDQWWSTLPVRLPAGTSVTCWSRDGFDSGGGFVIGQVSPECIEIVHPPRRIAKSDVRQMWEWWPDFKYGAKARSTLTRRSLNTTYILSILHWLENR
jgi:hypothetical protein